MFVFPVAAWHRPQKPSTYRKRIRHVTHVTGADCLVQARVHFPGRYVLNPETLGCEYFQESTYGFQVRVKLSKDEYESNPGSRLEDIACQKAKDTFRYKKLLNDVLQHEPEYREYEVTMCLPLWDPDCVEVHTYEEEIEEYVPMPNA